MKHGTKNRGVFFTTGLFVAIFGLSGCAVDGSKGGVPDLSFARTEQKPVYVGEYAVEPAPAYTNPMPAGFVVDPAKKIEEYFKGRFQASSGAQGRFVVSISNVSVLYDVKGSDSAIGQFLNVDKKDSYILQATIRLLVYDVGGYDVQKLDIQSTRRVTMSEHVSLAEREKLQIEAVHGLISVLDKEAQRAVQDMFHITKPGI
jgi:hypothetical protein